MNSTCESLQLWAEKMLDRKRILGMDDEAEELRQAINRVESEIEKSCLLDRMINCGEGLSRTPCPVHNGEWSGIHGPWPGSVWIRSDGSLQPAIPSEPCQNWYDAGCRCFMHSCGCTTGWQPDEACGCVNKGGIIVCYRG